jgi:hypothetical protein
VSEANPSILWDATDTRATWLYECVVRIAESISSSFLHGVANTGSRSHKAVRATARRHKIDVISVRASELRGQQDAK